MIVAHKAFKIVLKFSKSLVSCILITFLITCLLWNTWALALAIVVLLVMVWRKLPKSSYLVLLLLLSMTPYSFNKISGEMDRLGVIIRGQGAEALNQTERLRIYLGNISMGLVGFAMIAPEVSIETLLLMDPSGKDRNFNSDFAMKSPHVRKIINQYTEKVKAGSAPATSKRIPLAWGKGTHTYSMIDYRVALAVAGGGLFLTYKPEGDGYVIDCRITIDVRYSEGYKLDIFEYGQFRLYIDEAIFSALQDLNWFHPYLAHYRWRIKV